ncbi:MAG: NADH-quinone oxidoreductase subunit NuoE [Clostridia bacterium]|nr:NADH-quinone oxidoreductase subunit NuoE [Clostridia bacterium]
MSKCCCSCSCETTDKEQQLQEVFAKYRGQQGALIPVLQAAQDIYGYLPQEVLKSIAAELKLPISQVYGVVTFYAQFNLKPRGRYIIRVCQGTACYVGGGGEILAELQKQLGIKNGETTEDLSFTLESVACLGACSLAPVLTINDDTHGRLTKNDVAKILAQYE